MADTTADPEEAPEKKSKGPMLIGAIMLLLGGAGGFYATWSGLLGGGESTAKDKPALEISKDPTVAYVAVEPLVISLSPPARAQYLRFRASLEVPIAAQDDVALLLPRVTDVLNSYLRAVEPADLENTAALTRLRAQMLRRVQVVVGADKIKDLLIMEFVLN